MLLAVRVAAVWWPEPAPGKAMQVADINSLDPVLKALVLLVQPPETTSLSSRWFQISTNTPTARDRWSMGTTGAERLANGVGVGTASARGGAARGTRRPRSVLAMASSGSGGGDDMDSRREVGATSNATPA